MEYVTTSYELARERERENLRENKLKFQFPSISRVKKPLSFQLSHSSCEVMAPKIVWARI